MLRVLKNKKIHLQNLHTLLTRPYLVIEIVFVDVILMYVEFKEVSNCIHLNWLQLSCFESRLLIVRQGNISEIDTKKTVKSKYRNISITGPGIY